VGRLGGAGRAAVSAARLPARLADRSEPSFPAQAWSFLRSTFSSPWRLASPCPSPPCLLQAVLVCRG
jgi:hypothetical protein